MRKLLVAALTLAVLAFGATAAHGATFAFTGNSYNGSSYNQVPSNAEDLAVSPDGYAVTGAQWDEPAFDVRVYTPAGVPTGPRPGNSSGRFRENGGGPHAVDITNTAIYAAQSGDVVRWDRATYLAQGNTGSTLNGTTRTVGNGLLGVAACGSSVYVDDASTVYALPADLSAGVQRSWPVPSGGHLTCDREGDVWVLGGGHLYRYSSTGSLLTSFAVGGTPRDVAADPSADNLLVADNGQDQDIERLDYTGALVSRTTNKNGYLNSANLTKNPLGVIGTKRLAGPAGVGIDSAGEVYTAQTFDPSQAATGQSLTLAIIKMTAAGAQAWRIFGEWGLPGEQSSDGQRYYVNGLSYAPNASGKFLPYAETVDPWTGSDPRVADPHGYANTQEAEVGTHRLIGERETTGTWLHLYRADGELERYCTTFTGQPTHNWFLAANGDVWRAEQDQGLSHFTLTGWDGAGCPTYSAEQQLPLPPGFTDVERIVVDGSTTYVSGYGPTGTFETGTDDWKFSGKLVARFNGIPTASGWPTRAWMINVPWNTYPDRPTGLAAAGSTVAVAYLSGPATGQGYTRLFDSATGVAAGTVTPPASYGPEVGWLDAFDSINLKGNLLSVEGDGQNKTILATLP